MQLLLIVDDWDAKEWLSDRLVDSGYVTTKTRSVDHARTQGILDSASAIIVDLNLAASRGETVTQRLRDSGATQPLIVMSVDRDWKDRVASLDAGADDYLIKPVRSEEIAARLRAIFRRCAGSASNSIVAGDIELDLDACCAWRAGECLNLTGNEFRLLRHFMMRPGQIIKYAEIQLLLDHAAPRQNLNATEVLVSRLRKKIGKDRIRTIRKVGYTIAIDPVPEPAEFADREPCKKNCGEDC